MSVILSSLGISVRTSGIFHISTILSLQKRRRNWCELDVPDKFTDMNPEWRCDWSIQGQLSSHIPAWTWSKHPFLLHDTFTFSSVWSVAFHGTVAPTVPWKWMKLLLQLSVWEKQWCSYVQTGDELSSVFFCCQNGPGMEACILLFAESFAESWWWSPLTHLVQLRKYVQHPDVDDAIEEAHQFLFVPKAKELGGHCLLAVEVQTFREDKQLGPHRAVSWLRRNRL